MIRQVLDGALYAFALPDGGWGALYPGSHIMTSDGRVELPGEDVLGLVGTRCQGRLCLAGQGQQSGQAWLWTGRWTATGLTFGVSPCAFGAGFLFTVASGSSYRQLGLASGETVDFVAQIGTQGIRYVDGNRPVSGDATYRDGELFEWTRREDLTCGQGHDGGAWLGGMELEPGDCRFIRFERTGAKLGIGIVKLVERCAVLHWLSVAEVRDTPPKEPPPKPDPLPSPTHKEHTMIAYAGPVPGFLPGALEPHPDGDGVQIRKPNGKVVACTPEGKLEERDAAGEWEKFRKGKSSLIAERGDRLYVLPMAE